jgi:acetoacetate decarboxylase|tara:strand:- start:6420 stop:7190 length:771 start_codon:yes stop_codon:yes gene_type:complete
MGKKGRLKPANWGKFMPVHNPLSEEGPWYYRGTEMVMVEFATDPEAILEILPSELELLEPASAFMVIETNHWTTVGPYSEVYVGVMCTWKGETYAYCPGVYVTGENSQILGREIWGFGKRRADRIEVVKHDNGQIEAIMDVLPGDRALRAVMKPARNLPADALGEGVPLICLKVIPDAEGGSPALAQLVSVSFKADPIIGSDGKAEMYAGPGTFNMDSPSDVNFPIKALGNMIYAKFNADLPYGKVLKTYSKDELS